MSTALMAPRKKRNTKGAAIAQAILSPLISWDQKGVPPYYDFLKSKVVESLDEACYFYIRYQFDNNLLLMPHQWIIEAYEDLRNA